MFQNIMGCHGATSRTKYLRPGLPCGHTVFVPKIYLHDSSKPHLPTARTSGAQCLSGRLRRWRSRHPISGRLDQGHLADRRRRLCSSMPQDRSRAHARLPRKAGLSMARVCPHPNTIQNPRGEGLADCPLWDVRERIQFQRRVEADAAARLGMSALVWADFNRAYQRSGALPTRPTPPVPPQIAALPAADSAEISSLDPSPVEQSTTPKGVPHA